MSSWQSATRVPFFRSRLISVLTAFPVACFSLALASDLAYWQTENLLWLNFSSWLLASGLLFGALALLWGLLGLLLGWWRAHWTGVLLGLATLLAGFVNSLVHAGDGWTVVVPWGIALSVLTVLLMLLSEFLADRDRGLT